MGGDRPARHGQLVRALDGALIGEGDVQHVYVFRDDLVARMDVVEE